MARKEETQLKYPELRDMPQVTLAEAREQMLLHIKGNQQRGCILLVGESGIGKSQIFKQITEDTGMDLMIIYTAHFGLMGAGIPTRTAEEFFKIALPDVFPKKGQKALVLFDEVNRAPKHVLNMFFTLMEEGRIFNYVLPDNCMVAATMNPATAQYAVTEIENEPAFRRRMKWFFITPDFKGFLKHAESKRFHSTSRSKAKGKPCHPGVLSYFKAKPNNIYDFKAKDVGKLFCCPASIETVSEDVYNLEQNNLSISGETALNRISASIGVTMAGELIQHLKDSSVTLSAEDVLNNFPKVKKAIKSMLKKSMHEQLMDLSMNVLKLLFASTPQIKVAAENFLEFCVALPDEMTSNMLTSMQEVARENNAIPYLDELMIALMEYDAWIEIQRQIDTNHRKVDEKIKSR